MKILKDLEERVKELTAYQNVSRILYINNEGYTAILIKIAETLRKAFKYPEITYIKIEYDGFEAKTGYFSNTPWQLSAAFEAAGIEGIIEAGYTEVRPDEDEGPFYKEERNLLSSVAHMLGIYFERRKRGEQLEKKNKEREIMLREIHHRIKNNLQIVSSLIRLQSYDIKNKNAAEILKVIQNRVRAMSIIHERLYRSDNFIEMDYNDCFEVLINKLFEEYGVSRSKIRYEIMANGVYLELDWAIPCSMILNELVTNSLKHAFQNNEQGSIKIKLFNEDDYCVLEYSDDGKGLSEDISIENSDTLGFQLIMMMAQKINGEILHKRGGKGFSLTLRFRHHNPAQAAIPEANGIPR